MARVPAICEKCNTIFPSGFNIGKGATFVGCVSGPCPKCGGDGRILDGVYNAIGNAIEAFVGQQNVNDLKRLLEVLEQAKGQPAKQEEIIADIEKVAPKFSKLAAAVPKSWSDLLAFLIISSWIIKALIGSAETLSLIHI